MTEILIIAAVALVVIGPEKFPDFAKIVIRTVRDIRGYVNEAKRDLAQEFKPVKKEFKELSRYEPEKYIESLSKSVLDADKPAETGDQGTDRSQPVAAAPAESAEAEAPAAQEAGTEPYGGSAYTASQQGKNYPERLDG